MIVGEERPASLASSSKYCVRHITYPSPYVDRSAFEAFLADSSSASRSTWSCRSPTDDPRGL